MTANTWQPAPQNPKPEDAEQALAQALSFSQKNDLTETINHLNEQQSKHLQCLMFLPKKLWIELVENQSSENIASLILLLTLAEFLKPEWERGNDSPVIILNKILKQRKTPLTKEQLQWIKNNSRNKFLPNGSVF